MKAGQEPAPPECGGGVLIGGDTGQSEPATVLHTSTTRRCFGAGRCGNVVEDAAGEGAQDSTLLGI